MRLLRLRRSAWGDFRMVSTGVLGMQGQMDFGAAAARPGCGGGQDVAAGAGAGQDGGVRAVEGAQETGRVIRLQVRGMPVRSV